MYSVVLLMAMTSGGETAEFCRGCRGRGCGCWCGGGCHVARGCRRGCYGCYGCYGGYGCYGCYGCGGCYAYSGCGCYTMSYGGCYAVTYGGCYSAPVSYGCTVASPVTYSAPVSYGCVATAPVTTGCAIGHVISSRVIETNTAVAATTNTTPTQVAKPSTGTATIEVTVPADNARLTIDGHTTISTSQKRVFETPSLEVGKTYQYQFEANFLKDGVPTKLAKQITFKAGDRVRLDFTGETAVARK